MVSTSVLQVGIGLSGNSSACEYNPLGRFSNRDRAAIFMCIFFYFTSKVRHPTFVTDPEVMIYLFLIERVHMVRGSRRERLKDKLYLFNLCGLLPYCVIGILAIIFRVNDIDPNGRCLIGVERQTSILVIVYDLVINVNPLKVSFIDNRYI